MPTGSRKRCLIALGCLLLPCIVLNYLNGQPTSDHTFDELTLQTGIAELHIKLQHLHAKYMASQEEMQLLGYQLSQLIDTSRLPNDVQTIINTTIVNYNVSQVRMPNAYDFLPHLLADQNSLRPAYLRTKGRAGVSVVLGVPHVKRGEQSYLMPMLRNLVDSMSLAESSDTLIVVFIAETDNDYVNDVAKEIEKHFSEQLDSGLIDVIAPHLSYYPDFTKLRDNLGDTHQRVMWRSKQNLDFAFLMSYAQAKGTFYVQLEDDVITKKNFIATMKSYALQKISMKQDWFVLDFCQLGFIGKLFKSVDLPRLVQFFIIFYNDKPVDWLMDHLIATKICTPTMDSKRCKQAKAQLWLHYESSLFQHVGTQSSLKGKVQKLKDRKFGLIPLYYPHRNPEATIESQIKAYNKFTLYKAYNGDTYFWGLLPQPGDHLRFKFVRPIFITRYLFRSGNAEHPSDKFYNTTVEVLPYAKNSVDRNHNNVTEDGYVVIGKFDSLGIAQGRVDKKLGKIVALRLTVHSESDNWVILSEIDIEEDLTNS